MNWDDMTWHGVTWRDVKLSEVKLVMRHDVTWCDMMWCQKTISICQKTYRAFPEYECCAMRCNTIRCYVMWCAVMKCNMLQCSAMKYNGMQYNAMWCDVMWCYRIQCGVWYEMRCDVWFNLSYIFHTYTISFIQYYLTTVVCHVLYGFTLSRILYGSAWLWCMICLKVTIAFSHSSSATNQFPESSS